jgi:hypothetical protein
MSVLTANLKHLYQRRGMWLLYVILACVVLLSVVSPVEHPGPHTGRHIGLIMLASIIGFLVAMSAIEVLSRPFSYCLPRHKELVRKLLFSIAIPVSLLATPVFLIYPGLRSWPLAAVLLGALGTALAFYWLAVALAFVTRNGGALVGLIPLVFFAGVFFDLHVLLERMVVEKPVAVLAAGILVSIAAWVRLGRIDRARRYCTMPMIGFLDSLSRDKVQQYRNARAAKWDRLKSHPHPWVESFFLRRIEKCDSRRSGRCVWGMLYTTFAMMLSQWPNMFWFLLMVVLFAGYAGPMMYFMFFIVPLAVLPVARSPLYSSMLVSGGRRQRFCAMLVAALLAAALGAGFMVLVTGLSLLLAPVMPAFRVRGLALSFHAIDIRLLVAPLLVPPVALTFHVVFYKKPVRMIVAAMTFFYLLLIPAIIWQRELASMLTPTSVLCVLGLAWIVFVLALRHISARHCLVGP